MGTIRSTVSLSGTVGGVSRKLGVSSSATANEVLDNEFKVGAGDTPVMLFELDTGIKTGIAIGDFKQLVLHNSGKVTSEIIIEVQDWTHGAPDTDADLESYISLLLFPGQTFMLPNPRAIHFNSKSSAANAGQTSGWQTMSVGGHSKNSKTITDGSGYWDTENLAASAAVSADRNGIVPGSIRLQFYSPEKQGFGIVAYGRPNVTSSTDSKLAASTLYDFRLNIDGSNKTITFTTDDKDLTIGNPSISTSILGKIQANIDSQDIKVDIKIEGGDIVVSSRDRTSSSQVVLTAGTTFSLLGKGIFPLVALTAVAEAPMADEDDIMWESAEGVLTRANGGSGVITSYNEDSVTLSISKAPPNSTIRASWQYDSAHSGDNFVDTVSGKDSNCIIRIYGRSILENTSDDTAERGAIIRVLSVN